MFQGAIEGMRPGEGYRELLLAKVLVGEAADLGRKTDKALKFPPEREPGMRCACGTAGTLAQEVQSAPSRWLKLSSRAGMTRSRA